MPIYHTSGKQRTDKQGQEMIRRTIRRFGRFLMEASYPVQIGEVQTFSGLPMRVVRYVTREEYCAEHGDDIWGKCNFDHEGPYFFEVEVAD